MKSLSGCGRMVEASTRLGDTGTPVMMASGALTESVLLVNLPAGVVLMGSGASSSQGLFRWRKGFYVSI
jgi:hypothetical protein